MNKLLLFSLATGDGETIMHYCPSFLIVQLMSRGLTPQQACETAVKRMRERKRERKRERDMTKVGVVALSSKVSY